VFLCVNILRAAEENSRGKRRGLFRKFSSGIIVKQNHEKAHSCSPFLSRKGNLSLPYCTVVFIGYFVHRAPFFMCLNTAGVTQCLGQCRYSMRWSWYAQGHDKWNAGHNMQANIENLYSKELFQVCRVFRCDAFIYWRFRETYCFDLQSKVT